MIPAPRKPMPDTTCAATRVGLASSGYRPSNTTKLAAPIATRVLVRKPAIRWRHWRSKPMQAPSSVATARLNAVWSIEVIMTEFLSGASDCGHGKRPRQKNMQEIVAVRLEHRSPPFPRSARQAGERRARVLGRAARSHAAAADAIDFECCRRRQPRHGRVDVAEGGTAHGSLVRIEGYI